MAYIDDVSSSEQTAGQDSDAPTLESDLGWAIRMMSSAFRQIGTSAVADLPGGARGYLVLMAVRAGQARSQLALAQQLGLNKGVMTYLIDDLESAGLTTRRRDPSDRRAHQIVITAAGEQALDRARDLLSITESRLLGDLSPTEASRFRTYLERVALTAQRESLTPDDLC